MKVSKKTSTRKYLNVTYIIRNKQENKKSNSAQGRLYHIHKTGFWMDVQAIEVSGMHISFNNFTFLRNYLEIDIFSHPMGKISLTGEVEWYELILGGKHYKFNVGVSILDISKKNDEKFNKLFFYYKKNVDFE